MTNVSPQFRLSIWRHFIPKRTLVVQDLPNSTKQVTNTDNLQEEVYSWQTSEHPFDGVADDAVRVNLRNYLMERLNDSLPPSERGIGVLDKFIEEAEKAIESGTTEWIVSQGRPGSEDAAGTADRINSLLALTLYLKWLSRCFADRPGISVSVR